jgi:hypothetical protein
MAQALFYEKEPEPFAYFDLESSMVGFSILAGGSTVHDDK